MADVIAYQLYYDNIEEYLKYYDVDIQSTKVAILCFVKQDGRSHAFDFNRSIFSKDVSIDHAVIFCRSKPGLFTSYKTISHEVLHLFGAWDLYEGEPQNEEKAKKLKEMYPTSIMLTTYGRKESDLDEINAWRIGWNLNPQPFYVDYKPEYRKNIEAMARKKKLKK